MPVKKGSQLPRGEDRKKTFDVRTVRKMMADGMSIAQIAEHFGVSRQTIYQRIKKDDAKKAKRKGNGVLTENLKSFGDIENGPQVDPETGLVVNVSARNKMIIGRMGDERVSQFVTYQMDLLQMGQGVNKRDVNDLWIRFRNYLMYCQEHGVFPNNMSCYLAMGCSRDDISKWKRGDRGTPGHKQLAEAVSAFFASIHEQAGAEQMVNPILSIYWSKAHDGMSDQPKVEVELSNPLGDKVSAEEIAAKYAEVLPEDS